MNERAEWKPMQQSGRIIALYLTLSLTTGATGALACEAQSGAERAHLVELYTSEGCNSCPPAEKWMSSIRDKQGLVGLEFHVDYWDSTAWHDPYAKPAWARRQEAKARHARAQVYTPQVWLDGGLWKSWPKGDAPGAAQSASAQTPPSLRVSAEIGDSVKVRLQASAIENPGRKRFYVALTENRLAQDIRGGENKGRRLEHDQVVLDFIGPLRLPEAQVELKVPAAMALPNAAVVAFVQDEDGGETEQVQRLPLTECKR
ncbi:MAG: DUF1223 domain-containing protein [Proteobacteria bacterium]|nr:DUF1223 domain-containing protein [Pseudomonadota bacterium]